MDATNEEFLIRLMSFIKKHSYLYDRPNIRFFADEMWERIPSEWLAYFSQLDNDQLSRFPFEIPTEGCPSSLRSFHDECLTIRSTIDTLPSHHPLVQQKTTKRKNLAIKAKKVHELRYLCELIEQWCEKYDVSRIVDIGCGVGHLAELLPTRYVLVGVECDEKMWQTAKDSLRYVEVFNHKVKCDGSVDEKLLDIIVGQKSIRTAVVSLHGCGDLQPTILRHFTLSDRALVPISFSVSCCYHKMSMLSQEVAVWAMSGTVRTFSCDGWQLPVSALRLACQKHISSWSCSAEEHSKRPAHFIKRAMLECLYDQREDLRPMGRTRQINRNFRSCEDMASEVAFRLGLTDNDTARLKTLFLNIAKAHTRHLPHVEPFMLLQTMMQLPLELFIVLDRARYLSEHNCRINIVNAFDPKEINRQ